LAGRAVAKRNRLVSIKIPLAICFTAYLGFIV